MMQPSTLSEDEIIKEIIESFETFALGDIEYNVKPKPIAAFILSSCFIDQMAAFRYNHPNNENKKHYKLFIQEYLPKYVPFDLYVNLRCNLVHNYTVGQYLSITSEDIIIKDHTDVIHAKTIYDDLKQVFEVFKGELNTIGSGTRTNAINRYHSSRIITKKVYKFTSYNEEDLARIVTHYKSLIIAELEKDSDFTSLKFLKGSSPYEGHYTLGVRIERGSNIEDWFIIDLVKKLSLDIVLPLEG